ncbi:hypothetical protein T4B_6687, partial [Trichinella pseudospiralis]
LNAVGPRHHLAIHQQLGIMAAHDCKQSTQSWRRCGGH